MAIYIHCPHCHERLTEMHDHCTHCGVALPPGVLYALSVSLGITPPPSPHGPGGVQPFQTAPLPSLATLMAADEHQRPPASHSALRPWLAALLSLVCGLGQIYNGQVWKGVILLLCGAAAMLAWPYLFGKILAVGLWLYAVSDAYLVARRSLLVPL